MKSGEDNNMTDHNGAIHKKMKKDNDLVDCTSLLYTEKEIELLWSIR